MALISFGALAILFSVFLVAWSIWISTYPFTFDKIGGGFGIACALFHVAMGTIAILAGRDVQRNRTLVVACLVLGIVGSSVFVFATLFTDIIAWGQMRCTRCWYTRDPPESRESYLQCEIVCNVSPMALHLPVIIVCVLEAIAGITISSLACCKLCACCYEAPSSGQVQTGHVVSYVPHPGHGISYAPQSGQAFQSGQPGFVDGAQFAGPQMQPVYILPATGFANPHYAVAPQYDSQRVATSRPQSPLGNQQPATDSRPQSPYGNPQPLHQTTESHT